MARLYGSLQGDRKQVTRRGTVNSGIRAHVRGWNVGVEVIGKVKGYNKKNKSDGFDYFEIYATSGSNAKVQSIKLGTVRLSETDDTIQFEQE